MGRARSFTCEPTSTPRSGGPEATEHRWAYSLSNAGAYHAAFRSSLADLHHVDWQAVAATDFRTATVRDGKQAEFLVRDFLPWSLVNHIGVCSPGIARQVSACLARMRTPHVPLVSVEPSRYY